VQLVDEAMSKDRIIGLIIAKEMKIKPSYTPDDLYLIGISDFILKMAKTEDNTTQLLVQGLSRFRVKDFIKTKPYLQARVEYIKLSFLLVCRRKSGQWRSRYRSPAHWPTWLLRLLTQHLKKNKRF
jgi:ATP-dependent Lon protease